MIENCNNPTGNPSCQRDIWARGLCRSCYGYALRRGELGGYQKEAAEDRAARIAADLAEANAVLVAWARATRVRPGRRFLWGPAA